MDHAITDGRILAVIKAQGAELRSLRDLFGTEYIWQAGPAWPRFAQDEPAPIRRLNEGLLRPEPFPTPIEGRVLKLRENLFAADAYHGPCRQQPGSLRRANGSGPRTFLGGLS